MTLQLHVCPDRLCASKKCLFETILFEKDSLLASGVYKYNLMNEHATAAALHCVHAPALAIGARHMSRAQACYYY